MQLASSKEIKQNNYMSKKSQKPQYTFSVITAAYNSEKYISRCIMAVANNNYDLSKVEHIIVDDGSTDSTAAVVESYAKKYPHIKFYRKANSNWGGVINYVKDNKLIHNDYVVICDSDDVISRKAFSRVNKSVNDADFAIGGFCFWNGKHRNLPVLPYYYIFKRYMRDRKFTKVYASTPVPFSYYIKSRMFYTSPRCKENVPYQDIPLFFWAQRSAKTIINIPHIMGKYWSIRPDNTVSQAIAVDDKNFQLFLDNMHYLEKIDESTFAFLFLLRFPKWFQVIKQKNIKFTFKSPPSVRILPLYLRWITWIIYRIKVKKYFIIKKPKKGSKNK